MKILFIIPVLLIYSCTSYKYENKNELQKLIGLEIPSYKIVDSKMTHSARFDSEKTTKVTIKFNNKIDSNTYKTLDSLCSLPFQNNPNVSSSYFYSPVETAQRCWTKTDDVYRYYRITDFGEYFLDSRDAFFDLKIKKGSQTAELMYGNF
jgi:hypothetical protein